MNIKDNIDSSFRGIIYVVKDGEILCENITGGSDF